MGDYDDYEDQSVLELARGMLEDEGEDDVAEFLSDTEVDVDGLEPPIRFDDNFPNTLIVGNLPKVGQAKFQKLKNVVNKTLEKYGECTMEMPYNPEAEDETYGVAIVTYKEDSAAKACAEQLNGFKLDKVHSFRVVSMAKFQEIVSRSDEFQARHTLTRLHRSNYRDWMFDEKCREQLLLRYGRETEVYWFDPQTSAPEIYYDAEDKKQGGKIWCDWTVRWSPQGSFVCTIHNPGIALWAGPEFKNQKRLEHGGMRKEIDFSPNEQFVLSWNPDDQSEDAVRIHQVMTGKCVRKCRTPQLPLKQGTMFPHFAWSHDDQYLAEMTDSRILVRSTSTWELVKDAEGKPAPFKFNNLHSFQWSPKDNILAVWTLEVDNNPARLVLVDVATRKELTSRSRTQCEAEMYWQSEGEFLCLQVTKLNKQKNRVSINMEILRVKERQVPVDVVTIEDTVKGVFWETKGRRFAVLTTDAEGAKPKLLLYSLDKKPELERKPKDKDLLLSAEAPKCEQVACFALPSASYNEVVWAPEGQYFVIASKSFPGGASTSGDIIFAGLTPDNKLEILNKVHHYMHTDVHWDPSSRFVVTAVTQPMTRGDESGYKFSTESGYHVWSFQGRDLYTAQLEKCYLVQWRPHPPSLLPKEQQADIRKNLKHFSKKYDTLDEKEKDKAKQAFKKKRDAKLKDFKDILNRLRDYREEKEEETGWAEAMEEFLESQGWEQEEEKMEEVLEVTEELISTN
mmetsp:Transcript_9084/g.20137  ORF Transcript_9084/g.20137 Transcript_9084/m.20137 type:complete len:736 (-) Transcript_9084:179-2386(-)|eukprot:CAMPEP_0206459498 /NCGR_PEP_ID=MMETSP0324_2-20121206/24206_1 /ASSEMBLY_ACC=CAM_ASM_000836 /TAXON_ID=2866 /ORGANISM="Crypthecodinium cohnii, Strain Seligo" /LENGTH=735 /DNA_ID=CAMNT_0053931049 /DNA_START=124 /DNA_END=2331 /DNA_ORIENTATION=+